MSENGRNSATQLEPAPLGNRRAVTHGAYAMLTPAELGEVGALEDEIRDACPVDSARADRPPRVEALLRLPDA